MPLDLSEWVDKLESRARMARQWILELETYVPRREPFSEWMKTIRTSNDENRLQDLACEGARIPVEMNHVKMLQLELEAKNWSAKARRWTPGCEDSKKGKLEDLREHLRKGQALRSRLLIE
eukprot:CAMPEP_0202468368 /NCGR_PEP_ID=MMETSP1360-20130828/75057_1 /ASSEMBLY_ACC=CAM_ASM_000848 /TAXON_ID=515479 /ORGANISM="Licmophora paradoxa, Strain CCMP2313" /LENGTH=120 /DNA_ID=CAMNT_0049093273 /DNA_START=7 /DNA_END=366 /DNA_ORIENTATION=+